MRWLISSIGVVAGINGFVVVVLVNVLADPVHSCSGRCSFINDVGGGIVAAS